MIAHAATKPVASIDCPPLALDGPGPHSQVLIHRARTEKVTAGPAEFGDAGR
ncbi:hypothetical protein [Amycolatopsis saalfeldensis]|uniref:hypothetical protein n=1 Tax=Amycolatopsis saalfeldensis TaxID=394193 RepID=UPI0015A63DFF|nr:hypothetical protein [Amycolatopsis saalfeldensis]